MRLEIYTEPVEEEKVVRVRLVPASTATGDWLRLVACDKTGKEICLIANLSLERGLYRSSSLHKDLGFPMDGEKIAELITH